MLISQNVPNLVGGVSQQAEGLRYPSQCVEQINFYPTLLRGLSKRPPTNHVKELSVGDLFSGNYASHAIAPATNGLNYLALLGSGAVSVYDLAGTLQSVSAPGGYDYLTCPDPATQLRALTVADYTFIINTTKVVTATTAAVASRPPEALVMVKQVRDGSTYTIKLFDNPNDPTVSHTITVSDVRLGAASSYVGPLVSDQGDVMSQLNQAFGVSSAETLYNHYTNGNGELLYIVKKDSSNFRVEVECSVAEGMFAFKDSVQNFALLPAMGWEGFRIKVKGDPTDNSDDYYLKFAPQSPSAVGFAQGSWEEVQAPGLTDDRLVASTMPHALTWNGSGFTFGPLTWLDRLVGDTESNPAPSLVGHTVRDVFFRKNRLGFLAGGNVVLSCAGDFFNFWRTTAIQLLDSDVIDVAGEGDVGTLENAAAVAERLLLFSERAQSLLFEGDLLTPKTVGVKLSSQFHSTTKPRPKAVGNSLFFPFVRDNFSGFLDYTVSAETDLFEGQDITEHAPNYIKGIVRSFVVSDLTNTMAVQASAADTLYIYKFFKQGARRVQSSWSKFQFDGTIRAFHFYDSRLYVVMLRAGRLCLEWVDLSPGLRDYKPDGSDVFVTHLDRRVDNTALSPSYSAALNETTFILPFTPVTPANFRVVSRGASYGKPIPVKELVGIVLKVAGDKTSEPLWVGEVYRSEQELTKPAYRVRGAEGEFVVTAGRYQVRRGLLTADATLDFRVEVTPLGRNTFSYSFANRVLGTYTAVAGTQIPEQTKPFYFPVYSKSDQVTVKIVNDSYLPCNLLSLEWEALYATRSQRA